ncbi:MAG: hypothetical protein ACRD3G_05200 [Vicinamibacterales bacterium]
MPFEVSAAHLLVNAEVFTPKPFFTGWNRLEGRVRTEEFERALRAEARDPLWFLARQWQFLELKGDDAGSPIEAQLALRRRPLLRYAAHNGEPGAFPVDVPLEAVVERETPPLDRMAFLQIYRAVDRVLVRGGLGSSERAAVHEGLRRAYPFDAATVEGVVDDEARQLSALSDTHLFDVVAWLGDTADSRIASQSGLSGGLLTAAMTASTGTRAWYDALYFKPASPADTAWAPANLEYRFACATAPGGEQIVLTGDGYAHGRLDWFAVDVAAAGQELGVPAPGETAFSDETLSFVPTAINFAGMPSHRLWDMENRKIDFAGMTAGPTDVTKLLLVEFMLAYANDWCLIPVEVETGAVLETRGLIVHDVFGDVTLVRPADRGADEDWRRWSMFGLETRTAGDVAQPRLLMLATTPKTMEGAAIEKVVFLRDEMANMCWAVERIVPSAAGIGADGEMAAIEPAPEVHAPPAAGATVRYRLGTSAPHHWRPFVPVRVPGSSREIRLQRARLPHGAHNPLGSILVGPGIAPVAYFVNEEEIPRAGRIVTRSFQRTRWIDGRVTLWLGRRSKTGRGSGQSGLTFDVLEEVGGSR